MKAVCVVLLVGLLSSSDAPPQAQVMQQPNILFILTDDLDAESTSVMPKLQERMVAQGTSFEQAFVTTPQCCPSRASILTGKYARNHTVYDNDPPNGGAPKFRSSGGDASTIATWLDGKGYETILVGKYLNFYDGTYIPPGWDRWRGQMGRNNDNRYNMDGTIRYFDPAVYHDTDLFSNWAAEYIRQGAGKTQPFFMYLGINAPHLPAIPASRYATEFSNMELPRPPSFNETDVNDKPRLVRNLPLLTEEQIASMTSEYRNRLRSMLSVDDMIERLINELGRTGELDNTYIVFTSDNGYHMGQHRMVAGKARTYEEDIRVPLIVRGPGVPAGQTLDQKVLNIDFAPTFAKLGGTQAPPGTDGRSLVPLLGETPPPIDSWRDSFLIEFFRDAPTQYTDAFSAIRTGRHVYVEYVNGDVELYDLESDPYQLDSLHAAPEYQGLIDDLSARLALLKGCSGDTCRAADGGAFLATPKNLAASSIPTGVYLNWDDNVEGELAGYNVYRADAEEGPYTLLNAAPLSDSSYRDTRAPVGRPSYYWVTAAGGAGNESTPAPTSATRTQVIAPTGTIKVNGGAPYANNPEAELTLSASTLPPGTIVDSMRLRNEDAGTFAAWEPYVSGRSWTLSSEDGNKTVFVQFRDDAGNRSAVASDAIKLDTTAPAVRDTAPAENASGVSPKANISAYLSEPIRASSVNATTVQLFERGSSTPLAARVNYYPTASRTVLDPDADLKPGKSYRAIVNIGVRDQAGNQLDQDPSVPGNQRRIWFFAVRN